MSDRIFDLWLVRQRAELDEFTLKTDLVTITPTHSEPACRSYIAEYRCMGIVWHPTAGPVLADRFTVAIYFGEDHLRTLNPLQLVWLLSPPNVFHPNVRFPALCVGHLRPGIGLVEIALQVHSILTFQSVNVGDCLNAEAAAWARENRSRFPIDRRPLKRVDFQLNVEETART